MNLITEQIQLPARYSVTQEAVELCDGLIYESRQVQAITDAASQDLAVVHAQRIRKHVNDVEATRKLITAPLLLAQREVKEKADAYVAPLLEELNRVSRLVTQFQVEESRRVAEAERVRAESIRQLEQDRADKLREAQEAAKAVTTEAELDDAIAAEQSAVLAVAEARAAIVAPLPEPFKARGAATQKVMGWEVTDLHELYKANRALVRLEPNAAAIKSTCVPEMPVTGLKLWWENKTVIRSR